MSTGSMRLSDTVYVTLATTFAVVLVLSNIVAVKLVRMPFTDLALPIGVLTYPLTFLMTDLVAEIWGEKHARCMVYLAFFMAIIMLGVIWIAVWLPPHPDWMALGGRQGFTSLEEQQNAFASVFGINGILVTGSLLAYLTAQLLDVQVYGALRRWTNGRHLWLRNNASTLISQLVDTILVTGFYVYGGLQLDWHIGVTIIGTSYAYKAFFALCDTPFMYLGTYLLRRIIAHESLVTPPASSALGALQPNR